MEPDVWFRSSRSTANGNCVQVQRRTAAGCNGGDCVEVHVEGDQILLRDTKDPDGPVLSFTRGEWEAFVGGVKLGEFDL